MNEEIGESTASPRFNTVLLATFAAVAFAMAIVGLYGVLAFSVAQRMRRSASAWHWGPRRGRYWRW